MYSQYPQKIHLASHEHCHGCAWNVQHWLFLPVRAGKLGSHWSHLSVLSVPSAAALMCNVCEPDAQGQCIERQISCPQGACGSMTISSFAGEILRTDYAKAVHNSS